VWKPNCRASKLPLRQNLGHPVQAKECGMHQDQFRETVIALLRENDGELLRRLLNTLSRDKSLNARRLARCLIQQPELRDLIPH
jgi:hypothetical protein